METVEKIAEVVLYEGYLLYPYTRSTTKNQQRWNFGGVYPHEHSVRGGDDPWTMQTQVLLLGNVTTQLTIKVRFLHIADREVLEAREDGRVPVPELRAGDTVYRPWEEAIEREVLAGGPDEPLTLADLCSGRELPIGLAAGSDEEALSDPEGQTVGWTVRRWRALNGRVVLSAEQLNGDLYRLTVIVENDTPWTSPGRDRERVEVVRQAFISTHTILQVQNGQFLSLLEPPDQYAEAARDCRNDRTWPVLVGEQGEGHTMLSSPIILYDYPQIAPESPVNFFDTTEIDELLVLSVMTLTDEEKREMRETDPRAREILEKTESLSPEELMGLHGSIRSLQTLRRDD